MQRLIKLGAPTELSAFFNVTVIQTFVDTFQTLTLIRNKLIESLNAGIAGIWENKIKDEIQKIKRTKRNWEKMQEKYEQSLLKYYAISKSKESQREEESYTVYEARRLYVSSSLDLTEQLIGFKFTIEQILPYQLLICLDDHMCFHEQSAELLESIQPAVKHMESQISDEKEATQAVQERITKTRLALEEDVKKSLRPLETIGDAVIPTQPQELKKLPTEKEGYLIRRRPAQVGGGWQRRYCKIQDGIFYYYTPASSGKNKGLFQVSQTIKLEDCQFKISKQEDRRNVFELVAGGEVILLQAPNQQEMQGWLNALAASKHRLLSKSVDQITEQFTTEVEEIVPTPSGSSTNLMKIEESLQYSDPLDDKKNQELHATLKSIPKSDFVLNVFNAALQKDIAVQGKVYLTQNRLCFYSNILGFVNILVIQFCQVTEIQHRPGPISSYIRIFAENASHTLRLYSKSEKIYSILALIWKNSKAEQPIKLQELLVKVSDLDREKTETQQEPEKEEILAPSGPLPSGPVGCECSEHLEQVIMEQVFKCSAKELFELMFGKDSKPFWEKVDLKRGASDRKEGEWLANIREVQFMMKINHPMVRTPEVSVKETTKIIKREEGTVYVVETHTFTPGLPFGDTFSPVMRFCITFVSPDQCKLIHSIGINFLKSTMMKGVIKSNTLKEMQGSYRTFLEAINDLLPEGASVTIPPQETPVEKVVQQRIEKPWHNDIRTWILSGLLLLSILLSLWKTPEPVTGINWRRELSSRNKVSQRMQDFLDIHFVDLKTMEMQTNAKQVLNATSLQQLHEQLAAKHVSLIKQRSHINDMSRQLDHMERHLVWAMYLNWVEDHLQQETSTLTTRIDEVN
ncbi:hypothetical protein EDD86DRAFT_197297 [Gorgonomyces haynaldii]|nr:hypothetical protein EDD86DRAFT_197297 [Gorgonomyces haynaldii]